MRKSLLVLCAFLVFPHPLEAGILAGRIVQANGSALAGTALTIEGQEVRTNQFGGYEVTLPDGEQPLAVTINGERFVSDPIRIYSPRTKQNWRLNPAGKRLEKIL